MPLQVTHAEVLRLAFESWARDIHTAIPGRVIAYDAAKQVADVLPVIRDARPDDDGGTELFDPPVIPNVPMQWPRGGGYAIHFPITPGDHVILLFQESAIGHWRESGEVAEPGDLTRFGFGYPIAIPGVAPDAAPIADAPTDEGVIVVPGGKVLRIGGADADFVALSAKVDAQLDALKQAITGAASTEAGGGGLGGMTALSTALSAWPLPAGTAATQLKAK